MKVTSTQIVVIAIILIVGILVYRELPETQIVSNNQGVVAMPKKGCPTLQVRECIKGSYGREKYKCPPAQDECNGQQDAAACFKYEWRDLRKTPCPVCDSPKYTKKTAIKCN